MTRMLLPLGVSALALAGTMVGCAVNGGGTAEAGTRASYGKEAKLAGKALARRDGVTAVAYAEAAVAQSPRSVEYRMLLAQSYLQAGRFDSARAAFADVLRLSPDEGKAALNLALAEIATGDWQAARRTLDLHRDRIAASDFGLALALAGDPGAAVTMLTAAARTPGAGAKVRQNLGLALALSGQWPMARAVAAADLSPADVDARIAEWAQFAQPTHASDQVAALLGVQPVQDKGQPVALALVAPVSAVVATPAPVEPTVVAAKAEPVAVPVVVAPKPIAVTPARATPAKAEPVLSAAAIRFAPRQEVVQPLPAIEAPLLQPAAAPMKIAVALPMKPIAAIPMKLASATPVRAVAAPHGDWVVQLGAFSDTQRAHDAWGQVTRRVAGLGGHQPQGMPVRVANATLYRLSVAGFDRAGADALCGRVQARGAVCFVRREAGDQIAQWLRPTAMQLASR